MLNTDGKVLLENAYNTNFYDPSFPDTLVVWLNENNCVLLDRNGKATPIPKYTSVKYYGWN